MRFRKDPGRPGPVGALAECFGAIAGPLDGRRSGLGNHLMPVSAMFPLKHPSLLRSGRDSRRDAIVRGNLRTLSGTAAAPGDPPMRKRPGAAGPRKPPPAFRTLSARLRRGRVLEDQPVFDGHCLIPVDGADHPARNPFTAITAASPATVTGRGATPTACPPAWSATRNAGRRCRWPRSRSPGPTTGTGGTTLRAQRRAARSVDDLRRERRRLEAIVPQDGPRIARLRRHGLRSVPGAEPGGHAPPLASLDASPGTRAARFTDADGARHELRCLNGAPAGASRPDIGASVTGCRETVTRRKCVAVRHRGPDGPAHRGGGKRKGLPWVTDLPVDGGSPVPAMRAARSRWRTGNGTPARRGTRATAPGPASGTESGA